MHTWAHTHAHWITRLVQDYGKELVAPGLNFCPGPLLKEVTVRLLRLLCKSKMLIFPVDFINLGWAYWISKIMDINYFGQFNVLGKL